MDILLSILWAALFAVLGGVIGIFLLLKFTCMVPRLLNNMTPDIDEEKEILRGNRAVSDYFGRLAGSVVLGASVIFAAAIFGAMLVALR